MSYFMDHQAEIQRYMEQTHVPDDVVHPCARPDA